MTDKQLAYKNSLIQKIQTNKKNVFSDDDSRRDFMKSRFNCTSTKDMSIDQLNQMLNFCLRKVGDIPLEAPITTAQKQKIKTTWEDKAKNKSTSAMNAFILRITQRSSINVLTKAEATKVIIAVEKMT